MKILTLTEFELYELLKRYDLARQINNVNSAKWFSKREFSNIKDEVELVLEEIDELHYDEDDDPYFDNPYFKRFQSP